MSIVRAMASNAKRLRLEDFDSEHSDSSVEEVNETTGGLDSGEESDLDRRLANESDISR